MAVEVGVATASRAAWEAVAGEAERYLTEGEAALKAERRWPSLQAEIERRRTTRPPVTGRPSVPATPVRQPTRSAAAPLTAPVTPQPSAAAVHPIERHAAQLEAEGFHFAAQAERRQLAEADHQARRRLVEEEVARTERLFQTLGADRARGDVAGRAGTPTRPATAGSAATARPGGAAPAVRLALCGVCGKHMTTSSGGVAENYARLYRCSGKRHLIRRAEHIDTFIQTLMVERLCRRDAVDLLFPQPDASRVGALAG